MNSSALTTIITTAIITLLIVKFTSRVEKKVYDYNVEDFNETIFKVSKWMYPVMSLGFFISLIFFYVVYDVTSMEKIDVFSIILLLIGISFNIIMIYGCYVYRRAYVKLLDNSIIYYDGRKIKVQVKFEDIKLVYISNGYIVIDTGEKKRKIIPIYFKDSGKIVAILKDKKYKARNK